MQTAVKLLNKGYLIQASDAQLLIDPVLDDAILAHTDFVLFTKMDLSKGFLECIQRLCHQAPRAKIFVPQSAYAFLQAESSDLPQVEPITSGWFDGGSGLGVQALFEPTPMQTLLLSLSHSENLSAEQALGEYAQPQQLGDKKHSPFAYVIRFDGQNAVTKALTQSADSIQPAAGVTQSATTQVITQLLILGDHAIPDPALLKELKLAGEIHTVVLSAGSQNRLKQQGQQSNGCFSVHEAFDLADQLGVAQIVIRPQDPVTPSEVKAVFEARARSQVWVSQPNLLIEPDCFYVGRPRASVVIRTLNEARYLDELLKGIREQLTDNLGTEVVLVDSGSTDGTLAIAEKHGCKIVHIKREEFSFGRSLNRGCEAAQGDILVITSGHCVPASELWLQNLCRPLTESIAQYSYGKQLGGPSSYFSEGRVFDKYFPDVSKLPQDGFYCNNANSALLKSTWQRYRFDEELTGLEDMALAQRMVRDGGKVAYVCDAAVYHHHSETWPQVRRRFEREAIALQQIMPNVHVGWFDTLRYTISSIWADLKKAAESKQLPAHFTSIIRYRYYQYTGSYRGNQQHRKLSQTEKDQYFYPH